MIPILYEATEKLFTSNGLGRLADATSCIVTEERNGQYELKMEYPIAGRHYKDIAEEKIIYAIPSDGANAQPFRIYRITKPLKGIVSIYATHISYDLKRNTVKPFMAQSIQGAFSQLPSAMVEECNFVFWTDKQVDGQFTVSVPTQARSVLGGSAGSILDVYGKGEYEFDMWTVKLHVNRGADNGVSIRYGKNLTDIKADTNTSQVFTGVVPYFINEDSAVFGDPVYSEHIEDYPERITVPLDMSVYFDEAPTKEVLMDRALKYLRDNEVWEPTSNIEISFVALWQTEEYKDVAPLQRVKLCDTVTVNYEKLGVSTKAKVIQTVYNTLLERYDKIQLGSVKQNTLASIIETQEKRIDEKLSGESSIMKAAIAEATNKITGGLGGYVVIGKNADGYPEEIIIMDTDNKETCQQCIRLNKNGIAFSQNGYNGPFKTAWTIDGKFVAEFIATWELSANNIKGGTLTLGGTDNVNGQIYIYDKNGNQCGQINNNGIAIFSPTTLTQVIINPEFGFVLRDASGNEFYGLTWSTEFDLPALDYKTKYTYTGTESDNLYAQCVSKRVVEGGMWPSYYYKFKVWYSHGYASWYQSAELKNTGQVEKVVQLPGMFAGKNVSFNIVCDGIDQNKLNNQAYRGYLRALNEYNTSLPKCKADGKTWQDTNEISTIMNGWTQGETRVNPTFDPVLSNSKAYSDATSYAGTTTTHLTVPQPNPQYSTMTTSQIGEFDKDRYKATYEYLASSNSVKIKVEAYDKNGYPISEFLKIKVIATC